MNLAHVGSARSAWLASPPPRLRRSITRPASARRELPIKIEHLLV